MHANADKIYHIAGTYAMHDADADASAVGTLNIWRINVSRNGRQNTEKKNKKININKLLEFFGVCVRVRGYAVCQAQSAVAPACNTHSYSVHYPY